MVTTVIDHISTDLWVVRRGTKRFANSSLLNARKQREKLGNPSVAETLQLVIGFSDWQLPSGELTPVFVVRSDFDRSNIEPRSTVDGSIKSLVGYEPAAVDHSYKVRVGSLADSSKTKIHDRSVHVAVLTVVIMCGEVEVQSLT